MSPCLRKLAISGASRDKLHGAVQCLFLFFFLKQVLVYFGCFSVNDVTLFGCDAPETFCGESIMTELSFFGVNFHFLTKCPKC